MEIEITNLDHVKVVKISGDLNAATSGEAEAKIQQLIMGGNRSLIIDLEDLNYISSAGLRIFLSANKLVKKSNGEIRFCNFNKTVKEVFEISGFMMIFKYYPNLQAAVEGSK